MLDYSVHARYSRVWYNIPFESVSIGIVVVALRLPRSAQSAKGAGLLLLGKAPELLLRGLRDRRSLRRWLWLCVHVGISVVSPAGRCRLDARRLGLRRRMGRHAKEIRSRSRCGCVVVKIEEGASSRWRRRGSRGRREQIVDRSPRYGGSVGWRGTGDRSGSRNGRRRSKILVVIIVVVVLHADAGDLGNNGVPPSRDGLAFLYHVHPDGHGRLFAVGSRY